MKIGAVGKLGTVLLQAFEINRSRNLWVRRVKGGLDNCKSRKIVIYYTCLGQSGYLSNECGYLLTESKTR